MNIDDADSLEQALARYEISLAPPQIERLDRYCRLLWDWNEKLNLTRHTTWDKFVARDLVDSLQLSQLLEPGQEVLDVGTGGGVPGIVLAILREDVEVSVCESVQKKARAVQEMVGQLDLPCAVYAERAEKLLEDLRYDVLVARAVGPLWKMCKWFQNYWHEFGCLLAVKGPGWVEERAAARERGMLKQVKLRRVASYPMPGTDSESVILRIEAA
ncbi:MAG: 16S rRNA (guanine(527)-N(7))-methyltransferase RsmG [Pirellulaceae bacterium]|nr:16S rRNA (guanine(527)-N(7))-methyltransferase RsmG [Pirellulaceae bacterium]